MVKLRRIFEFLLLMLKSGKLSGKQYTLDRRERIQDQQICNRHINTRGDETRRVLMMCYAVRHCWFLRTSDRISSHYTRAPLCQSFRNNVGSIKSCDQQVQLHSTTIKAMQFSSMLGDDTKCSHGVLSNAKRRHEWALQSTSVYCNLICVQSVRLGSSSGFRVLFAPRPAASGVYRRFIASGSVRRYKMAKLEAERRRTRCMIGSGSRYVK
jgi:hypothetical protein